MHQTILHSEAHLYPCQLSSSRETHSGKPKFMFYSPLNHYSSLYDSSNGENDLIDLEGTKYSHIKSLQINSNTFNAFYKHDQILLCKGLNEGYKEKIELDSGTRLVSNVISCRNMNFSDVNGRDVYSRKSLSRNMSFLSYLTVNTQSQYTSVQNKSNLVLNFRSCKQLSRISESEENIELSYQNNRKNQFNPQEDSKCESRENQKDQNDHKYKYQAQEKLPRELLSQKLIEIPIFVHGDSQIQDSSYEIYNSPLCSKTSIEQSNHFQNGQIYFFNKKTSQLSEIDLNQDGIVTSTINCDGQDSFQPNINFQHNKIALLSEKILLNYGQNGIMRIIDKRLARIVQVRDLQRENDQVNIHEELSNHLQQNYLKFFDFQRRNIIDIAPNSSTNFVMNLKNQIVQFDLRKQNYKVCHFRFNQPQMIGDYSMAVDIQEKCKQIAFTTSGHSSYRGFVIDQQFV